MARAYSLDLRGRVVAAVACSHMSGLLMQTEPDGWPPFAGYRINQHLGT
jgi:hypothetical protein